MYTLYVILLENIHIIALQNSTEQMIHATRLAEAVMLRQIKEKTIKSLKIKQALRSSCGLLRGKDSNRFRNRPLTIPDPSLDFNKPSQNLSCNFFELLENLRNLKY